MCHTIECPLLLRRFIEKNGVQGFELFSKKFFYFYEKYKKRHWCLKLPNRIKIEIMLIIPNH